MIIMQVLVSSLLFATATSVSGGSPGKLTQEVDLRTGYYRQIATTGPFSEIDGFDGTHWTSQNGLTSVVDLPGIVADRVAFAYLLEQGWLQPRNAATRQRLGRRYENGRWYDAVGIDPVNGSHIEAWFDATTHRLARAIVSTDTGPDRTDYGDYRKVRRLWWPFRQHETSPTGAVTDTSYHTVRIVDRVPRDDFAPPAARYIGVLHGSTPLHFQSDSPSGMGHIIASIVLRGQQISVIFDTGGQNVLDAQAAYALRARGEGGLSLGGSGTKSETASIASVGRLTFANGALPDQRFIVFPFPYSLVHPMHGEHIGGIVGAEILANFGVVIDYAQRTLKLVPFPHMHSAGTVLPFLTDGSHMYVYASIDGARGLFGIDTGDGGAVTVFDNFARHHALYRRAGIPYLGLGAGGTDPELAYRSRSFELAGVSMNRPLVHVARSRSGDFSSRSLAGNIGAAVLSRFTLTIDYRSQTIAFSPNQSIHEAFSADRTGLTLTQHAAGSFDVLLVAPDTPAAEAGVRAGDRIIAVNGHSVNGLGTGDFDPYRYGQDAFVFTIQRGTRTLLLRLHPRALL